MPYPDFVEMGLYEQIEPFGEWGDYYRTGIVASLLANIHRDPKKRNKPFAPSDFMPSYEAARPLPGELSAAEKLSEAMKDMMTANPQSIRVKKKKRDMSELLKTNG